MACALAVGALRCARRLDAADQLEQSLSIVYSVPLATTWRSITSLLWQSAEGSGRAGDEERARDDALAAATAGRGQQPKRFVKNQPYYQVNRKGWFDHSTSDK